MHKKLETYWRYRFENKLGGKCTRHGWEDENGGICPSCARYGMRELWHEIERLREIAECHAVDHCATCGATDYMRELEERNETK